MNVLIACEFSGIVREAFNQLGHNAWSCDLISSEKSGNHINDDILKVINGNKVWVYQQYSNGAINTELKTFKKGYWDLLIGHPPCTYLANSANSHLYIGGKGSRIKNQSRWVLMKEAANFFLALYNADINKICIENPIMSSHAKKIIGVQQSQVIQPWMFGHGETKATCLWLKNLPLLKPTDIVNGREHSIWKASPSPDRWKIRSRTFQGIAEAFAEQWSL